MKISLLAKDTIIYGLTNYLGVFASLFLTPLYTRYFEKFEYGILEIFNSWTAFAMVIVPLGLNTSIMRLYNDFKEDEIIKSKHLGTIFTHLIFQTSLYVLLMLTFKSVFFKVFNIDEKYSIILYLSVSTLVLQVFTGFFLTLMRVKFEKSKYLFVTISKLVILNAIGVILVLVFNWRIESFFVASLASSLFAILALLYFSRKEIFIKFDWKVSKEIMSYSIHILSAGLLFQFTNLLDRVIISNYDKSLETLGVFSIGLRIGNLVNLILSAFALAWFPHAMNIHKNEDSKVVYAKVHKFYIIVVSIVLFLLFLYRKEILLVMAPAYMDTYFYIPIIAISAVINGLIYFYSLGLHIKKETKHITISAILSIIFNIIISIASVGVFGVYGVLFGTFIGMLVWVGYQWFVSNKIFHIKYNYSQLLILVLAIFLSLIVSFFADRIDVYIYSLGIKTVFLIITAVVIAFLFKDYFERIKQEVRSFLGRNDGVK